MAAKNAKIAKRLTETKAFLCFLLFRGYSVISFAGCRKGESMMKIIDIKSEVFESYGKVIGVSEVSLEGRKSLINYFHTKTEAPTEGNLYVADELPIHELPVAKELQNVVDYDELQIGYCHGYNTRINALEWHDCQELVLAATDCVLYLGHPDDLIQEDGQLNVETDSLIAVKLAEGDVIALHPRIMHFSPTKVNDQPYRTMIVLEKGTNQPLEGLGENHLFMTNKWLIAHPDRQDLVDKGAWPGLRGKNYDWEDVKNS